MSGETREVRLTLPGPLWIKVRQYAVGQRRTVAATVADLLKIGLEKVSPPEER